MRLQGASRGNKQKILQPESPKPAVRLKADCPPASSASKVEEDLGDEQPVASDDDPEREINRRLSRPKPKNRETIYQEDYIGLMEPRGTEKTPIAKVSPGVQTEGKQEVGAMGMERMWLQSGVGSFVRINANTLIPPPKVSGEYLLQHAMDNAGRFDLTVLDILKWTRVHQRKLTQVYYALHEYVVPTLLQHLENRLRNRRGMPEGLVEALQGYYVSSDLENRHFMLVVQLLATSDREFMARM